MIISPIAEDLKTIWKYRSLIVTFAIQDLKQRYRNTFFGFLWSLLEPLVWFGVLYTILIHIIAVQVENFALYLFLGILMYHAFTRGTSTGLNSILHKEGILGRVALPLETPIISSVITSLISMTMELLAFFIIMVAAQFLPPSSILLLPLVLLLETVLIFAVSLPLSVINVFHRDVQYVWMILTHIGIWLTPVAYRFDLFPANIQIILSYIPIGGIIDLGHAVTLGTPMPPTHLLLYTIGMPFVILFWGYVIFKHLSSKVADEL